MSVNTNFIISFINVKSKKLENNDCPVHNFTNDVINISNCTRTYIVLDEPLSEDKRPP
jgi:hypothetical protein